LRTVSARRAWLAAKAPETIYFTFFQFSMRFSTLAKWLLTSAAMGQAMAAAAQYPSVLTRTPSRNGRNVSPTAGVSLTFSEAISATTSPFVRIYGSQSRGKRTFTTNGAGTAALSYQPTTPFAPGELVQVSVPASMRSAATNNTSRYETFQFRVASARAAATFTYPPDVTVGQLPVAVATADLDGDGDIDFVTSNRTGNSLSVRLNNGTGRFTAGQEINLVTATAADPQPIGVQLADMDGDGDFDIVQANTNYNSPSIGVFLNAGNAIFTAHSRFPLGGVPGLLNVADFTGDGSPDVVFQASSSIGGASNAGVTLLENNSYGNLNFGQQAVTQAYSSMNFMATGDVDNNGSLDAMASSNNGGTAVLANQISYSVTGATQYGLVYNQSMSLANISSADVAVGDLDNDGDLDLVRTPTASGQVVNVHLNNGQGAFNSTTFQTVTTAASTDGLLLADLDGDGDLDLIASNYADGSLSLCLNNGTGALGAATRIGVGRHPTRPAVADLNGDGRLDILVPLSDDNTVLPLLNQAAVTATRPAIATPLALFPNPAHDAVTLLLPPGTGPVAVQVFDMLGRAMISRPGAAPAADGTVKLFLGSLTAGVYRLQTKVLDGAASIQPLVIE
jgi:hypothetical protein